MSNTKSYQAPDPKHWLSEKSSTLAELESVKADLKEAKKLLFSEAAAYQDEIERYHQRALKAEEYKNTDKSSLPGEPVGEIADIGKARMFFDSPGTFSFYKRLPIGTQLYLEPQPEAPNHALEVITLLQAYIEAPNQNSESIWEALAIVRYKMTAQEKG
jgi:hypothetical protein